MEQYIKKTAVVAEIERLKSIQLSIFSKGETKESCCNSLTCISVYNEILSFLDTLEVKEVDLELEQRIKECPFRQVVCNKYENTPVECDCNCSWVVDYPKLKELKAQKGENAKDERYVVGVTGKFTTTTK